MNTLNHTVVVEVDFETLEDAETFHDELREFMKNFEFKHGLELGDYSQTSVLDRPHN